MRGDIRYVHQVIVMTVTNQNHRSVIGRSWQQSFYGSRIGGDARTREEPTEGARPSGCDGIAEKRIRQEDMPTVFDKYSGNPEVRYGDNPARISAVGGHAPYSIRARRDRATDGGGGLAASREGTRGCDCY